MDGADGVAVGHSRGSEIPPGIGTEVRLIIGNG